MRRRDVVLGGSAALAAAPAFAQTADPALPPPLAALLDLPLTTPAGRDTTLGAHIAPGPAIISFWATWCAPCLMEARHLARVRARYAPAQLSILGLNIDRERDEDRIAAFLQRARTNFTQLRADMPAYVAFGGDADRIRLPRLYVFAADGRPAAVFGRYNGAATLRTLDRAVADVVT